MQVNSVSTSYQSRYRLGIDKVSRYSHHNAQNEQCEEALHDWCVLRSALAVLIKLTMAHSVATETN